MNRNKLKNALSLTLIITMLVCSFATTSFAGSGSNKIVNGRYTAEKVSNPDMVGEKVADGLQPGGDRMNSYAEHYYQQKIVFILEQLIRSTELSCGRLRMVMRKSLSLLIQQNQQFMIRIQQMSTKM